MFAQLLVPTDFSAPSEAALGYARMLADASNGSLHALHVLPNVFLRAVVNDPHALEHGALGQLRDWLTHDGRLRAAASVVRSDEPADEIVSFARSNDVDLIVMGTRGRSGVAHVLVGSVAEKVVRTAQCPVLTVHTPPGSRDAGLKRILVPVDFSTPSDAALDCAGTLARPFGASVHLLHVLEESRADGWLGAEGADAPDTRTARVKDAQEKLGHRLSAARPRVPATSEVIVGVPARTIVDYAADNGFDAIVIGTHGRTGLNRLLMGSVAERIVRNAHCPVLTTRMAYERVAASGPIAAGASAGD